MASFIVEGNHRLHGEIVPQGAKNEALEVICATMLTTEEVVIENVPFLLSDTVGFIRKLPTQLVEAFKSTLDEVREADILLHVVDISHPGFEEQMEVVENTLRDIGAANKPIYVIFNSTYYCADRCIFSR